MSELTEKHKDELESFQRVWREGFPETTKAISAMHREHERLRDHIAKLLAACEAMLEPFGAEKWRDSDGRNFRRCSLCKAGWMDGDRPLWHSTNCPIPIAEAAVKAAKGAEM